LPAVADDATVQIVLADSGGKQLYSATNEVRPEAFAAALRRTIAENQLTFARRLVEEDRTREAKRVLYQARRSKERDVVAEADAMLSTLAATP
jgi:hypothetical protein